MRKRFLAVGLGAAALVLLLLPLPSKAADGTRSFTAFTYKAVCWNRSVGDGVYEKTWIYPFPRNFLSLETLWKGEQERVTPVQRCNALVTELGDTTVTVEPLEGEPERRIADRFVFERAITYGTGLKCGDIVELTYSGAVAETYPAQIDVTACVPATELRTIAYTEQWLDKTTAARQSDDFFSDIVITRIYKNCFFAQTVIPFPYEIKLNGSLSDEWCVGDQVVCTYTDTYLDQEHMRVEADMQTVAASNFELDPNKCYKPVIYLYPQERTEVTVELALNGELTCTYPAYGDGWTVTAAPDGTLTDRNGQSYSYLYWEGKLETELPLSEGFCVKGEDTAAFFEQSLAALGLTRREANEFIVYWLPLMQAHPYNVISFQTAAYTDAAQLHITPSPDTVIRVFMTWKPTDTLVTLPPQVLTAPQRSGFTVVEWGGTQL